MLQQPNEWNKTISRVTNEMREHIRQFNTFLFEETKEEAKLSGCGSFVSFDSLRIILTCEHVVTTNPLSYSFHGAKEVFRHDGIWNKEPHPVDVAFTSIGNKTWAATQHKASEIPKNRFANNHATCCKEELLFFYGFSGENSKHIFGEYHSNGTGYCSQEKHNTGDDDVFEIFWNPDKTDFILGTSEIARKTIRMNDPSGFSGSLIWNTRYMETVSQGNVWSPECAVVTGLIRRWDTKTKSLLCHRIEHVVEYLERQLNGT